ncbi:hypothetical protein BCR34DRAFT_85995 [Clohesyomyces aquaticus]|uniref:Uncharacterized protein n=1 Tax=Clohesyomyces aquaticus TaxID=1231657 RepID=A0A1Y2A2R2_9PLEO|nr:hypothetical protein BCR34DRAFT_85995 [Clohesyomyces aquaticus]
MSSLLILDAFLGAVSRSHHSRVLDVWRRRRSAKPLEHAAGMQHMARAKVVEVELIAERRF